MSKLIVSWLQEIQVLQYQHFVLSLSKSHEIIKNNTDISIFLKLVRLHFPLEMVKTHFNRSFLTFIKEMPIQSDKSWFSKVFFYMPTPSFGEFIPNESQTATFYRNYANLFLSDLHVFRKSHPL